MGKAPKPQWVTDMVTALFISPWVILLVMGVNTLFSDLGGKRGVYELIGLPLTMPMLKTFFIAFLEKKELPESGLRLLLISFLVTPIGLLVGMVGSIWPNKLVGFVVICLGITISLVAFLPLQRATSKSVEQS